MVAEGAFREDLFYRLKGIVLRTPSLAERPEDVSLLALMFLRRTSRDLSFAPDALAWLNARTWPGNVRELRAVIEAASALAESGRGTVDSALLRFATGEADELTPAAATTGLLAEAIAEVETRMLREALVAAGGNQSEAARALGVSRVGLIKKVARLGLRS